MAFGIAARISLTTFAALLSLLLALLAVVGQMSLDAAQRNAAARLETSITVAWDALKSRGSVFSTRDGKMFAGDALIDGDLEMVDRVKRLVGGVATVFLHDTRVTTNVIAPDGKRAIGTKLAAGPVYETVVRKGMPFRGEADILGSRYLVAYDPIKTASGEFVGILFVGILKSEFFGPVYHQIWMMVGLGMLIAFVAAVGTVFVIRYQLAPLARIRAALASLMAGQTQIVLPAKRSSDDIGHMWNAVEEFREATLAKQSLEREAASQKAASDALRAKAEHDREETSRLQEFVVDGLGMALPCWRSGI